MAATKNLEAFANAAVQVTCTLSSLANGSTRESASSTNSTNLYFDYHVQLTFTILSGSPSTTGPYVNVYAAASGIQGLWPIIQLSGGTTKTLGAGDSSVGALSAPNQLTLLGTFAFQTTSSSGERTFRTEPMSLAAAFGGAVPFNFSILVENQTGVAFSTSTVTTGNYLDVSGIYTTSGN